jgi:hypothetical protein
MLPGGPAQPGKVGRADLAYHVIPSMAYFNGSSPGPARAFLSITFFIPETF